MAVGLPHGLVAPEALRATGLVPIMSARLADVLARPGDGVVHRGLSFAAARFDWSLYRNRRHEGSVGHAWLRRLVAEVRQG